LRKIVFMVAIFLAFLLIVEMGVTLLGEQALKKALRSQYGLPSNLKVSINSFPLTLSLIRNHFGEVRIVWENDLAFMVSGSASTNAPYSGQVVVYDIELNITALMRGRIDIRRISRIKASVVFDEASINMAFGLNDQGLKIKDGEIFSDFGSVKTKYKVKASTDNTLVVEPQVGSSDGGDSAENPKLGVYIPPLEMKLYALPFDARLENVVVREDKVYLEISIPSWEGYL